MTGRCFSEDDVRKVWLLVAVVISLTAAACNGPMDPNDPMMPDPMMPSGARK